MNRYYISVAGWNGAGVTAPCIIIGREFEAETERTAGEAANKRFPQFASPHEGQNVVREELEEAERAIVPLKLYIETRMWNMVKANQTVPKDDFKAIREAAVNLAVEAIQVAAMAKKFEHGQRNNWPGAREDSHGEEKNRAGSGNSDNHHEPTGGGSGKDCL